jgi:hypothetical protein
MLRKKINVPAGKRLKDQTGLYTYVGPREVVVHSKLKLEATYTDGTAWEYMSDTPKKKIPEAPKKIVFPVFKGFSVDENTDTSKGFSLGTLTATDEDSGETFKYSIVSGFDASSFSIGGANKNELVISNGILNFETKSKYSVKVRVTDSGGNIYDETLTVNVNNLNEKPTGIEVTPVEPKSKSEEKLDVSNESVSPTKISNSSLRTENSTSQRKTPERDKN